MLGAWMCVGSPSAGACNGVGVGDGVNVGAGVAVAVNVGLGVAVGVADGVGDAVAVGSGVGLAVAQAFGSVDLAMVVALSAAKTRADDDRAIESGADRGGGATTVRNAQSPRAIPPRISAGKQTWPMWRPRWLMRGSSWLTVGDLPPMPSCDIILSRLLVSR
jgi:hypothetical protein